MLTSKLTLLLWNLRIVKKTTKIQILLEVIPEPAITFVLSWASSFASRALLIFSLKEFDDSSSWS